MVEYKVVDNATGRHLGPGEVGEIVFRAPHIMNGYYKQQDETVEALNEEGWFRSGDAGYYDSAGSLYIVERLKDLIKCLDCQVTPVDIENLLKTHPLVLEAAVVGIDHPELGEAPTAFVVTEPSARGCISEEELVRLVAGDAGYYDSAGSLYIVERLKDLIKCLDCQVTPVDIENLLKTHPLVLEAAVVGIDHPELGEAPTAFVVTEPSAVGASARRS
ncbi:hypothetical protein HPB50_009424 [Hyalomma asiaticum]|uniref:Uncharacterized protein n=1 Tax=Hyalomma asiaticum TaxID=266040 RepID=A0ACB7RR91_HYAAI|nr:hypothetical protein HPB50_009424 [Hyalomma asiaticum]